jgi:prophage DNA circulation protein
VADALRESLIEASFEGIAFPTGKLSTEGGHDSVEHTAYRRNGADVEPTGVRAKRGTIEALFLNGIGAGTIYPARLQQLLNAIERTPLGRLQHPTEGLLTAHVKTWRRDTDPQQRGGEVLELQWVEHNASVSRLATFASPASAPADSPTAVTARASAADAAGTTLTGYAPTAATIAAQLAYLDAATRSYAQTRAALDAMQLVVTRNLALASLAVATAHPAVAALEALRASVYALRSRYLPDPSRVRSYTVPRTQPLWQLALHLYGDATRTDLLLRANAIHDPLFVRAGTVLTVPPRAARL